MTHLSKSSKTPGHSWQFGALGTTWSIETPKELTVSVRSTISRRIEEYDKTYSRFRDDSLARQLRVPGEYRFSKDVTKLFNVYKKLYNITGGQMTPLIGGMLEDAGYDAEYSLQPKEIHNIPSFESLGWDGEATLTTTEPIVLDVGAAGKGYLVDIVAEILQQHGVVEYVIDASGDVLVQGATEVIGLEHLLDAARVIGTANITNQSLCASAVNRRTWQGLHHVFDPLTRQPTKSLLAAWVVADTALIADALATALFFVPATDLAKDFSFTYVTMNVHGGIDVSPKFDGELFI